ncbi:hypothetical protein FOA52_010587 [Chlamydomonas sp. UWO 241]|nr:hypothetical protein FOA52_010587 [Chlamydomonas sp. UWO 241]
MNRCTDPGSATFGPDAPLSAADMQLEFSSIMNNCFIEVLHTQVNGTLMAETAYGGGLFEAYLVETATEYSAEHGIIRLIWDLLFRDTEATSFVASGNMTWAGHALEHRADFEYELMHPNADNAPGAYLASVSNMGSALAAGAAADLTDVLPFDKIVDWTELPRVFRSVGLLYDGRVRAMPVQGVPMLMMTSAEMFEGNNWAVPSTLRQLAAFAAAFNGTGDRYALCIPWCSDSSNHALIYKSFVSSYIQTGGSAEGIVYDRDTLNLKIVGNEAAAEVLMLMKVLYKYSARKTECDTYDEDFAAGRCMITLQEAQKIKHLAHPGKESVVRGQINTNLVPGSAHVLDRALGQLVPCTADRCPMAQQHTHSVDMATYRVYTHAEAPPTGATNDTSGSAARTGTDSNTGTGSGAPTPTFTATATGTGTGMLTATATGTGTRTGGASTGIAPATGQGTDPGPGSDASSPYLVNNAPFWAMTVMYINPTKDAVVREHTYRYLAGAFGDAEWQAALRTFDMPYSRAEITKAL